MMKLPPTPGLCAGDNRSANGVIWRAGPISSTPADGYHVKMKIQCCQNLGQDKSEIQALCEFVHFLKIKNSNSNTHNVGQL